MTPKRALQLKELSGKLGPRVQVPEGAKSELERIASDVEDEKCQY